MASQTSDNVVGSSGPRKSSEGKRIKENVMASSTGDDDAGSSGEATSFRLLSQELPSKRLLGKGLSGIGYETTWRGKRYARKDFVGVPSDIFEQEAAVLVGLKDHENIVKTYGWTVDNRSCSLVLEYMDDDLPSLLQKRKESKRSCSGNSSEESRLIDPDEFIKEIRKLEAVVPSTSDPSTCLLPLELAEALDMMLQIATGMAYLHKHEIAHGDLKPRNILVSYSNKGVKSVKVADFGLIQTKSKSMFFVSRWARKLDMARWKAPEYLEMIFGHKLHMKSSESDSDEDEDMPCHLGDYDGRCRADVYSFAVTSFQILTGEVPYPNRKWKDLVELKIGSKELRPELPAAFQSKLLFVQRQVSDLLESCLGDLDQRPTFSFIRNEIERIIRLQKTAPSPANVPEPFIFQADSKPVISIVQRKQRVPKPTIQLPHGKRRKMDVAPSSSSKPVERLVLDSRLQNPVISEYPVSSLSEIEMDSTIPHPSLRRKSMEATDSSSNKPVERSRSSDSDLEEGFFAEEEDSVSSLLERLDNQIQKLRELDDAAATASWAPPAYVYTSSPIKKRVSRALKRCVIVSSHALKRPSVDYRITEYVFPGDDSLHYDNYSGSKTSHRRYHYSPQNHPINRGEEQFHDYDDKRNDGNRNPGPEIFTLSYMDTSRKRWKKALARIPSKIQHWAFNSVEFCKPKSSDKEFNYIFPGPK